MNRIKKNIAANFAGNIWQSLMGLAFIPLQIRFMGVESYGMIGIFAALQAMLGILDMGLSATLNREMARLSVFPGKGQEMRHLVRSLELICWCITGVIGIGLIGTAPLIAHHWIRADQMSPQTIESSLRIMGFAVALQLPSSLYSGGLMGLQRQVLLNAVSICANTFRSAGAVLILWLISPTIQAFFSWHILGSLLHTFLLALCLWRNLPQTGGKGAFQPHIVASVWRFAAGMGGISILATILTQLDKVILSRMLSLESFGYYTLAGVVAMSLYRIIGPVLTAIYPRLTQLVSLNDREGLKNLYHESCQFMSVLIFPIASVIAFFSYEILLIWTQNLRTAENSHLILSILVCGTALNGLLNIPYGLQLAYGWLRLSLITNIIAIVVMVPMILFMTIRYGALGGASVWTILNGCYILICIHFMHRRLLTKEKLCWYWQDVSVPLSASLIVPFMGRFLMVGHQSQFFTILYLGAVLIFSFVITALATKTTRCWFINKISAIKFTYGH